MYKAFNKFMEEIDLKHKKVLKELQKGNYKNDYNMQQLIAEEYLCCQLKISIEQAIFENIKEDIFVQLKELTNLAKCKRSNTYRSE